MLEPKDQYSTIDQIILEKELNQNNMLMNQPENKIMMDKFHKDLKEPKKPSWAGMKDTDWRKILHLAMEEVKPADWYYGFIEKLLKSKDHDHQILVETLLQVKNDELKEERERIIKIIKGKIVGNTTLLDTQIEEIIKQINLWKTKNTEKHQ